MLIPFPAIRTYSDTQTAGTLANPLERVFTSILFCLKFPFYYSTAKQR